jgi:hypothetical protein
VYTGYGLPCGPPCDEVLNPDDGLGGGARTITQQELELLVIPLAVILLCSLTFYAAARAQATEASAALQREEEEARRRRDARKKKRLLRLHQQQQQGSLSFAGGSSGGGGGGGEHAEAEVTTNALLQAAAGSAGCGDSGYAGAGTTSNAGTVQQQAPLRQRHHSTSASALSMSLSSSTSRYFSGLNSFAVWWADYNNGGTGTTPAAAATADEYEDKDDDNEYAEGDDYEDGEEEGGSSSKSNNMKNSNIEINIDAEVAHSQLWQASKYRIVFWYAFGYFFLLLAVAFAALLYGRPLAHTHGLLPWTHLREWTALQAGLIVVSTVMMTVYFLPLAYLPHDFKAGRAFQNDPAFLRKIGAILWCFLLCLSFIFIQTLLFVYCVI